MCSEHDLKLCSINCTGIVNVLDFALRHTTRKDMNKAQKAHPSERQGTFHLLTYSLQLIICGWLFHLIYWYHPVTLTRSLRDAMKFCSTSTVLILLTPVQVRLEN